MLIDESFYEYMKIRIEKAENLIQRLEAIKSTVSDEKEQAVIREILVAANILKDKSYFATEIIEKYEEFLDKNELEKIKNEILDMLFSADTGLTKEKKILESKISKLEGIKKSIKNLFNFNRNLKKEEIEITCLIETKSELISNKKIAIISLFDVTGYGMNIDDIKKRKKLFLENKEEHKNYWFLCYDGEDAFIQKNQLKDLPEGTNYYFSEVIFNGN